MNYKENVDMDLKDLLNIYRNTYFLILAYFDTNGHDHVDSFGDYTELYWAIAKDTVFFSDEKFDVETLKEVEPHYDSPILGKACRKDDYTMIFMDLQTGDYIAGIFDNSKEETNPEIIKLLEDW